MTSKDTSDKPLRKKDFETPKFTYDFQEPQSVHTIPTSTETLEEVRKLQSILESGKATKEEIEVTGKKITEILNRLVKEGEQLLIEKKRLEEDEEKTRLQKALESFTNFDQSDIRLNFEEYDSRNTDMGKVLARCHDDHIEIMVKGWISEFRYFENFITTINHESIHAIVDRIILEDGFDHRGKLDSEWMFYAGCLDKIEGLPYIPNMTYYLDMDTVKNSIYLVPAFKRELVLNFMELDYNL